MSGVRVGRRVSLENENRDSRMIVELAYVSIYIRKDGRRAPGTGVRRRGSGGVPPEARRWKWRRDGGAGGE